MTELEPVEDPISIIARQLTGGIASTCCYKGGWNGGNPQCECRDLAERILETWPTIAEIVTLSSAQSAIAERDARIAELEAENTRHLAEIDRKSSMPGDYRYWEGRYRDAEALLKEAGPVLALTNIPAFMTEGLDGGRGVVTIRFDDVEGMRSFVDKLRAARSLMSKIGERNE